MWFRQAHSTNILFLTGWKLYKPIWTKNTFPVEFFLTEKRPLTLSHNMLLEQYGFRGNFKQWFSSFLPNRTQATEIDSAKYQLRCTPRICPRSTSLLALYQ